MVVTIECRDTINGKVTIVLCNGARYFFSQASSGLITINGRVYRAGAFDACAMDNAAVRYWYKIS